MIPVAVAAKPVTMSKSKLMYKKNLQPLQAKISTEKKVDVIAISKDLYTVHAVNKILLHSSQFSKTKNNNGTTEKKSNRFQKEQLFEKKCQQAKDAERANRLKWQGRCEPDDRSTPEEVILEQQQQDWIKHKATRFQKSSCSLGNGTVRIVQRTRRVPHESRHINVDETFDVCSNDEWAQRHSALQTFQQCVKRVMLQLRAERRLIQIRPLVTRLKSGGGTAEKENNVLLSADNPSQLEVIELEHILSRNQMFSILPEFPLDSLPGPVDIGQEAVDLGHDFVPIKLPSLLHDLVLPHAIKVSHLDVGWRPSDVSGLKLPNFQTVTANPGEESLPADADSELQNLHHLQRETDTNSKINLDEIALENVPQSMLGQVKQHPLHIFNPLPGVQFFSGTRPFCVTDPDYAARPVDLAAGETKEVMSSLETWKSFDSVTFDTFSHIPRLTNVYLPQWSDPYDEMLLPRHPPPLLSVTSKEVRDASLSQCTLQAVDLTLDTVRGEFALPSKEAQEQTPLWGTVEARLAELCQHDGHSLADDYALIERALHLAPDK
ncbi:PREDICTED: cilia- and flagella-associated protein 221-like [Priapulus caudatus]|uniref:Cilia- and flagella-associated protein 221-like n=1 Tax=Priapulus caudatus TaxID=37621 RepID=A0ABM1DT58_PRICU|nr:PREDICTED: cilia- and flagella-associated protein 221-like [Priapulus caudatus]